MADKFLFLVMVPMVYLAFFTCAVGVLTKIFEILRAPKHPHTLQIFPQRKASGLKALAEALTMPTVLRAKPVFWVILMVFHWGILFLVLSHLDLLPQINIISSNSEHMIGNGAVGAAVTLSVLYFLLRRFASPVREISVPADYLLLLLLFLIFITGDTISWANSWSDDGFIFTKQDFGAYLNGLIHFTFEDPGKSMYGGHYVVIAVHVLLANIFLMVLPFSKIMHTFFAVALNLLRRTA